MRALDHIISDGRSTRRFGVVTIAKTGSGVSAEEVTDELLTVPQLAARLKISAGTIYNEISAGGLTLEHGVVHFSHKCTRIDWRTFREKMLAGAIRFGKKLV